MVVHYRNEPAAHVWEALRERVRLVDRMRWIAAGSSIVLYSILTDAKNREALRIVAAAFREQPSASP
ncbi:hypothetical protein [Paraburkholderia sp. BL10I2N1]|uniref:hypothetical protein n=1 Tax=Paraburkholderia sp. BL10I2N1 TaxID=1938796 RepID=UPI00105CC612|nr:hypothetical protein [Paraburkholderia sp. BL10I2N1]TDN67360.1 hypothetical protein B0G77_0624 [Paraburkholderia sp. BL10I2N1]